MFNFFIVTVSTLVTNISEHGSCNEYRLTLKQQ